MKESIAREAAQREQEKITKSTDKSTVGSDSLYPPAVSTPNPGSPALPSPGTGLQPPPGDFHSLNYSMALDRVMDRPAGLTANPTTNGGYQAVSTSY